jgi:hypothetical protein
MFKSYIAVLLVPTGIGCAIGGYAGDALPVARALAQGVDWLITHPNVLNGAQLYWPMDNVLYVEGYGLDQFAAGDWDLQPVGQPGRQNRVGLVLDREIEPDLQLRHIQAAEAARATLGLTLTDYIVTDQPLGVSLRQMDSGANSGADSGAGSGASWGIVENLPSLFRAVERLIDQARAEAIAVVARFPDDQGSEVLDQYRQASGVDPIGGAEAIISHGVTKTFQIPCAHAPALAPLPVDSSVSPRVAAEELGYTFLPCVLVGLSRAPQYRHRHDAHSENPVPSPTSSSVITTERVDAVVVPASACGGPGVLHWAAAGKTIVAVENNTTRLAVSPEALGIRAVRVGSYLEALGFLVADRSGVNPELLIPKLSNLNMLSP